MSSQYHDVWIIQGKKIPAKIHFEYRKSSRTSIGKKSILVRIPEFFNKADRTRQINWAKDWLSNLLKERPEAVDHILIEELPDEYDLTILDEKQKVKILYTDEMIAQGNYKDDIMSLTIAEGLSLYQRKQEAMKLISKLLAKKYIHKFSRRVAEINQRTFKISYDAVKLKNIRSRWGSCSSKGNLNFSTRLLLCPEYVIDYVIIHELAHRLEMNHSWKFWRLVEKAMPDYGDAEAWIKKNGSKVNFIKTEN